MTDDDAPAFDLRLREVMEVYGRAAPSETALCGWWRALGDFDWSVVEGALVEHVAQCKFAPTPADIVERLVARDGRPGPEAAWSLALQAHDEQATVVWTQEIAEAFGVAKPVLDAGDEVGARKAFQEAYRHALAAARREMRPAEWRASLGQDPRRRADALSEAQRLGRLPADAVARLLPAEAQRGAQALTGPVDVAGLLGGKVTPFPAGSARDQRRLLAAVREGIRQGAAAKAAERERVDERRRAHAAELERLRRLRRAELARRGAAAPADDTGT